METLLERIRSEIALCGPMAMDRYMELALYDETEGYYATGRPVFGGEGDFYTAPGVHAVFGETIADYIVRQRTSNDNKAQSGCVQKRLRIVEFGAGDARLAVGICGRLQQSSFQYTIIERSDPWRQLQRGVLRRFEEAVCWMDGEAIADHSVDFIVANELLDAFPMRVFERIGSSLFEWKITIGSDSNLRETKELVQGTDLPGEIACQLPLGSGYRFEWNARLSAWLRSCVRMLRPGGCIVVIDYGGLRDELYGFERKRGTLRAYKRHSVSELVYANAGQQDITADVDFDTVQSLAASLEINTMWYGAQRNFLVQSGILERLTQIDGYVPLHDERRRRNMAIKHLVMPGYWERFRVWVGCKSDCDKEVIE